MVYQEIKDKLYHGHRKIARNTKLQLVQVPSMEEDYVGEGKWIKMTLHDNIIAKFYPNHLELFSCGWYTPTTKDRLNLALQLAGVPYYIYQKDWEWFYGTYEVAVVFEEGMGINY